MASITPSEPASGDIDFIPAGTTFAPEDITFWAGKDDGVPLDAALDRARIVVCAPHATARIPAEVAPWLAPAFTRRLQYDFSDVATAAVGRAWAAADPRVVLVENPHPRLVRDPNRARPDDLAARLRAAIDRVRAAGPYERVDLTGVDAIRPVTFSFFPMLAIPEDPTAVNALVDAFVAVGEQGLAVYERTRDALWARVPDALRVAFHDTMSTTTTRDGAVNVPRAAADAMPPLICLSNRGDADGGPTSPEAPVTMESAAIRALAEAFRAGFAVEHDDVTINRPYGGSQEILVGGRDGQAVQFEFRREVLLGPAAVAVLHQTGVGWPTVPDDHVAALAQRLITTFDAWLDGRS